ncbi:nuclear transport factor 2 family protein [Streptomyces sp. NEAU-W12]|uniref:nuclear transport factor 2 family protein n=1 Tax=Streptomyces sp. NEAU-W12 TaxID=2994668 RepID=UPI00224B07CB|nr:nuclear transport factor 2 family protein [Streptomyces sp. NEAU-W12]MCX2926902.1 nuclear transport factor 2 family protein [Streptomyces sp. NEAU-W12]
MTAADADVVRELERRRFHAIVERDFDGFAELVHPELSYTHSSGTLDTLGSFVGKCESAYFVYHRIEHVVDSVTVAGDTAVVVGEMRVHMTAGGVRRRLDNRSLGVWARIDGTWKLLAHQATAKG